MSLRLELPWPHRDLSPNRARNVHWSRKAGAVKNYRHTAKVLTLSAINGGARPVLRGEVAMTVTFIPPDSRRRDRTNMEASFKAGFDGIADALGVDDNCFAPTYRKGEPQTGGKVIVEIAT
jgi:crossover junction endodeoxyribonuclease RusA